MTIYFSTKEKKIQHILLILVIENIGKTAECNHSAVQLLRLSFCQSQTVSGICDNLSTVDIGGYIFFIWDCSGKHIFKRDPMS